MPTASLCWIWVLFLIQTSSAPNDNFLKLGGLEHVRGQLRSLWIAFAKGKKPAATGVQVRSVVFYKMRGSEGRGIEPCSAICVDRQPPKGVVADTCEKQRDSGYCKARLSGSIKDGFCARTCNLCEIQNFGMRTTFGIVKKKAHRVLVSKSVTLEMQPTGLWRYYNTHNGTSGLGVNCKANRFLSHTINRQLHM